jgi:hypothetical protein
MPSPENTISIIALRKATLKQIRETLSEIEEVSTCKLSTANTKRVQGLLDLYLGTLPKTYRGDIK